MKVLFKDFLCNTIHYANEDARVNLIQIIN